MDFEYKSVQVSTNFPYSTIRITEFPEILDKISKTRIFGAIEYFGILSFILAFIAGPSIISTIFVQSIIHPGTGMKPKNLFLFESVAESSFPVFLSLVIAFFLSLIIHELGHILSFKKYDVEIKDAGLTFFLFIPIYAYTKRGKGDEINKLKRILSVHSGGVNFNCILVALGLLFFALPATPSFTQLYFFVLGGVVTSSMNVLVSFTVIELLMFWTVVINLNLTLLNSLPIFLLDGGQCYRRVLSKVNTPSRVVRSGFAAIEILVVSIIINLFLFYVV